MMRRVLRARAVLSLLMVGAFFGGCKTNHPDSNVKDEAVASSGGETSVQWWDGIIDDKSGKPVADTYKNMQALCATPKPYVDPPDWRLPTLSEVQYLAKNDPRFKATFGAKAVIWVSDPLSTNRDGAAVGMAHLAWTAGASISASDQTKYYALCVAADSSQAAHP